MRLEFKSNLDQTRYRVIGSSDKVSIVIHDQIQRISLNELIIHRDRDELTFSYDSNRVEVYKRDEAIVKLIWASLYLDDIENDLVDGFYRNRERFNRYISGDEVLPSKSRSSNRDEIDNLMILLMDYISHKAALSVIHKFYKVDSEVFESILKRDHRGHIRGVKRNDVISIELLKLVGAYGDKSDGKPEYDPEIICVEALKKIRGDAFNKYGNEVMN